MTCRAVPSAAFRAMLPLNPSVTTTSAAPLTDAVGFDEADIIELRQVHCAEHFAGLANFLMPLHLLDADIEEPDRRLSDVEQHARHGTAHHRQRHQMARVAADRGAEIQHD